MIQKTPNNVKMQFKVADKFLDDQPGSVRDLPSSTIVDVLEAKMKKREELFASVTDQLHR